MSKHERVPGVRLKFRTARIDGDLWVFAAVWVDDEQRAEIASARIDGIEPGDPIYHAWVDAVSRIFHANLERLTGIKGFVGKRLKPDYRGEQ